MEHKALKAYKVPQVLKAQLALKAAQERKEQPGHKARQVHKAYKASQDQWLEQPIKWSTKTVPT